MTLQQQIRANRFRSTIVILGFVLLLLVLAGLIGLAFECQRVNHIPAERWDVPLDALLTEKNFFRFTPR